MYIDTKQGSVKLILKDGVPSIQHSKGRPKTITPREAEEMLSGKLAQLKDRAILELESSTSGSQIESILSLFHDRTRDVNALLRELLIKEGKAVAKLSPVVQTKIDQPDQAKAEQLAKVQSGEAPAVAIKDSPEAVTEIQPEDQVVLLVPRKLFRQKREPMLDSEYGTSRKQHV